MVIYGIRRAQLAPSQPIQRCLPTLGNGSEVQVLDLRGLEILTRFQERTREDWVVGGRTQLGEL